MKTQATQDMKCVILQGKGKEVLLSRSSASKRSEGQPYRPPSFLIALPRDPGAALPLAPCHPMAASPQLLMAVAKPGAALPKKTWKKKELFSMFTYGDKDENIVELGCSTQFADTPV